MEVYKSTIKQIKIVKHEETLLRKAKITSSKSAAEYMYELFDREELGILESFKVLFLNRANITTGWYELSKGGITGTVVDVRLLFRAAVQCGATSFIAAHNHPSGNLKPSEQDKVLTNKLKECGKIMDIGVMDHIILAPEELYTLGVSEGHFGSTYGVRTTTPSGEVRYFSFADEGLL